MLVDKLAGQSQGAITSLNFPPRLSYATFSIPPQTLPGRYSANTEAYGLMPFHKGNGIKPYASANTEAYGLMPFPL